MQSWRNAVIVAAIAIACANLPFALAWGILEWSAVNAVATESAAQTPNPEKSPFINRVQEWMTYIDPRLANVAHHWNRVHWVGSVIWGLAAAALFGALTSSRLTFGAPHIIALVGASIFVGLFLAWPWIAVIAVGLWL